MSNPVTPFSNNLFGSRPTIKEALDYAEIMINTFQGTEYAAAKTAIGVVVNTIENVIAKSLVPSPKLDQADMLSQLGAIYDKLVSDVTAKVEAQIDDRISANQANVFAWVDMWASDNLRDKVMDIVADDDIDDQISNWMSNNFDITDYNVDDAIDSWMDNNLDDKVADAARCLTFTVEVSR